MSRDFALPWGSWGEEYESWILLSFRQIPPGGHCSHANLAPCLPYSGTTHTAWSKGGAIFSDVPTDISLILAFSHHWCLEPQRKWSLLSTFFSASVKSNAQIFDVQVQRWYIHDLCIVRKLFRLKKWIISFCKNGGLHGLNNSYQPIVRELYLSPENLVSVYTYTWQRRKMRILVLIWSHT